jgi:hypothetical protein
MKTFRVASLMAAAAIAGLTGQSYGQYTFVNTAQLPYAGTDDTAAGGGGVAMTYGTDYINNYLAYPNVTLPSAYLPGAGAPYVVTGLDSTILLAHSSVNTYTTAYLDNSGGVNYFGQYSPSTTLQYVDSGATYQTSSGTPPNVVYSPLMPEYYHAGYVTAENSQGVVAAYEGIEAPDSSGSGTLGRNAFLFNIPTGTYTTLGLTGLTPSSSGASYAINFNYSNVNSGTTSATYQSSTVYNVDNAGNSSGTTNRYFAYGGATQTSNPGNQLGVSTWFYNASNGSTTETGEYGTGYSYQKTFTGTGGGTGTYASNTDYGTKGGYEVGTVTPYVDLGGGSATSLGTEVWEYSAATNTTTPISLYQSGQTPSVSGVSSFNGNPLSFSYNASGQTASTARSSKVLALNASGLVGGYSSYYAGTSSAKGQISWVYNPHSTSYTPVGLTANGFASGGNQSFVNTSATASTISSSTISAINAAGATAGTSTQFLSTLPSGAGTVSTNTVAWYTPANSSASVQIGPNDSEHLAVASAYSYITDSVLTLSDSGLVAGSATRYVPGTTTTNGSDAFVYDANSGQTLVLDPNSSSSGYFSSTISYLAPNGVAVGTYKNSSSGTAHAFIWSAYSGFTDLSNATTGYGSGVAANVSLITNAYSYDPASGKIFVQANYLNNGTLFFGSNGVDAVIKGTPIATSAPLVSAQAPVQSGVPTGPVGSGGGAGSVSAVFSNAGSGGTLTVNYDPSISETDLMTGSVPGIAATGATPFILPTAAGDQLEAWDVSESGGYSGLITLVFQYDPSLLLPGIDQSQLEIWHYTNGSWQLPANEVVNTTNDTITVTVSSLSPFALGAASVPEPVSLGLILPAAAVGLLRRRKRA